MILETVLKARGGCRRLSSVGLVEAGQLDFGSLNSASRFAIRVQGDRLVQQLRRSLLVSQTQIHLAFEGHQKLTLAARRLCVSDQSVESRDCRSELAAIDERVNVVSDGAIEFVMHDGRIVFRAETGRVLRIELGHALLERAVFGISERADGFQDGIEMAGALESRRRVRPDKFPIAPVAYFSQPANLAAVGDGCLGDEL